MRILVEVEDGCVINVYCDDINATVCIIDHDYINGCKVDGGSISIDDILHRYQRED